MGLKELSPLARTIHPGKAGQACRPAWLCLRDEQDVSPAQKLRYDQSQPNGPINILEQVRALPAAYGYSKSTIQAWHSCSRVGACQ